eukprot:5883216-Alexandrium_andersonii.AAC.1
MHCSEKRGATASGSLPVASTTTSGFRRQLPTENKKGRAPWAERANKAGPDDTIAITADVSIEGPEVVTCYP